MSDTTAADTPREESPQAVAAEATPKPSSEAVTPVWVWIVYGLGVLAAMAFAASIAIVVLAQVTGGGGLDISVTSLVIWLVLGLAAIVTFVRRRWGGRR